MDLIVLAGLAMGLVSCGCFLLLLLALFIGARNHGG